MNVSCLANCAGFGIGVWGGRYHHTLWRICKGKIQHVKARTVAPWIFVIGVLALAGCNNNGGSSSLEKDFQPGCKIVAEPVWEQGTIFLDPDIIRPTDPTTFVSIQYAGRGIRNMFDRRVDREVQLNAFLFEVTFENEKKVEFQINPEFNTTTDALKEAKRYTHSIGQLPAILLSKVKKVVIHKGDMPFGGGNNELLIHSVQSDYYIKNGILEETLVHEAVHTSLDGDHYNASWDKAACADNAYISAYAKQFPAREDIAESFLPYIAVRYKADRVSDEYKEKVQSAISHRMEYFDAQSFDMLPWKK